MMLVVHQTPSLTAARYEEVVRRLTGGKERIESVDDVPFDGLLVHAAAETENGFLIVDVFESAAAFARFGVALGSIPLQAGIVEPARAYPVHTFVYSP
jgi:hypothetical protein